MSSGHVGTSGEREVSEQLARCVATMVFYQADGWSWSGAQLLWEQTRSLQAWASESGLGEGLSESILTPLEGELSGRFGPEVGLKLHREFLRALEDAGEGEAPAQDRHRQAMQGVRRARPKPPGSPAAERGA